MHGAYYLPALVGYNNAVVLRIGYIYFAVLCYKQSLRALKLHGVTRRIIKSRNGSFKSVFLIKHQYFIILTVQRVKKTVAAEAEIRDRKITRYTEPFGIYILAETVIPVCSIPYTVS